MLVCGHIMSFSPNLFDNYAREQCTIPNWCFTSCMRKSGVTHRSSPTFFTASFFVLLDDLFAFLMQVPAPYRIAVFSAMACSGCRRRPCHG
jgi:hypothetical protein